MSLVGDNTARIQVCRNVSDHGIRCTYCGGTIKSGEDYVSVEGILDSCATMARPYHLDCVILTVRNRTRGWVRGVRLAWRRAKNDWENRL